MSTDDRHDRDDHDEEPPGTTLADPDDYHRRQRLKEIHQRRQRVVKVLDDMDPWTGSDEHNRQQLNLAHAVALYVAELEPVAERTDESIELRDALPWDDAAEYADKMGYHGEQEIPGYQQSNAVYRACNRFLADVKPLIEPDEQTEWEV
jgi:hypothetical protein